MTGADAFIFWCVLMLGPLLALCEHLVARV